MSSAAPGRRKIGIWAEWPPGFAWSNEGMVRLLGFLIEGAAQNTTFSFQIVVPHHVAAEAKRDFSDLAAQEGRDYSVHAPSTPPGPDDALDRVMRDLAAFANTQVEVDGWLILFPHFSYATLLDGPKAVIFPDSIPRTFPYFHEQTWGADGQHKALTEKVSRVLAGSDAVVVFSRHVATEQAQRLFHVPMEKLHVAPHALPDLAPALPFVRDRRKTDASRRAAADLLRGHAKAKGLRYLADFPFEDAPYIVVSTQDRVTKNIAVVGRALDDIVRKRRQDLKLITTALLHFGEDWTPLPGLIEHRQIQNDLLSMHDLPRDVHAALYHCAEMAVHPSFFEGGHAPFPFSEAVSVGTPCLIADGPHTRELLEGAPELRAYVFDPQDSEGLADLIMTTLTAPTAALATQTVVFDRLIQARSWGDVAREYVAAVPQPKTFERPASQ